MYITVKKDIQKFATTRGLMEDVNLQNIVVIVITSLRTYLKTVIKLQSWKRKLKIYRKQIIGKLTPECNKKIDNLENKLENLESKIKTIVEEKNSIICALEKRLDSIEKKSMDENNMKEKEINKKIKDLENIIKKHKKTIKL